jgi:hypothetical protein
MMPAGLSVNLAIKEPGVVIVTKCEINPWSHRRKRAAITRRFYHRTTTSFSEILYAQTTPYFLKVI